MMKGVTVIEKYKVMYCSLGGRWRGKVCDDRGVEGRWRLLLEELVTLAGSGLCIKASVST
jgi:hypothetical protein